MEIIRLTGGNTKKAVALAVGVLRAGGIVAYPTETFYGLGCRFDCEAALKRLYRLKGRPPEKAMPLIAGKKTLRMVAKDINELSRGLMARFWPGPLTLLLTAKEGLSRRLVKRGKVAVRTPGESFALRLAKKEAFPITATSANPSGMPPAKTAKKVVEYFGGHIDLLIDGGKTPGGLPSTVADATGKKAKILRQGAIRIRPCS